MDNQLLSISKIFSEKLFRIPDYQRGYSWGPKQLKDFWNDIIQLEMLTSGIKNHYVGVLTLEKVSPFVYQGWLDDNWIIESKSFEPYFIVDGQQRLTTTIILLQAILESVDESEKLNYTTIAEIKKRYIFDSKDDGLSRSYIFGYEKDNPSYEFLKTKIFLEQSSSSYTGEETVYTQNLAFAKTYFREKLSVLSKEDIETTFRKVTQNLLFNIYSINSDIDVFITFETMNNRGKPLSTLELLKNRLIYLSTKFNTDENEKAELRKRINESWKGIYHFLGKNKDLTLKDDAFLLSHFIIYFGHNFVDIKEDLYQRTTIFFNKSDSEEYLLERIFTLKNLSDSNTTGTDEKISIIDVNNYIESLLRSVKIYFSIYNPVFFPEYSERERLLLDQIVRVGLGHIASLFIAMYLKTPDQEERIRFLKTFERFMFINRISMYRSGFLGLEGQSTAISLMRNHVSLNQLQIKYEETIKEYISKNDFIDEVTRFFKARGFYQWDAIRYFFYEYEMHLKESSKTNTNKINWSEFVREKDDYVTIEHIYPQNPRPEGWGEHFQNLTSGQRKAIRNSLGNLLPLSRPKNSSLQNKPFLEKVDGGHYIGYKYGSFCEIEISHLTEWTPLEILKRGIKLLNFMEKRWKINLGSENQKIEILNLTFLKRNSSNHILK